MIRRIALLGLSGVGKSTLISRVNARIPLLHLQASALIKAEQAYRAQTAESSESLRTGAVIGNQDLMITAYQRVTADAEVPIVFDGHSVIDGQDGIIAIPTSVFQQLMLNSIFYLFADPKVIFERRQNDFNRKRPVRDVETLADHQRIALSNASRIANELGCPFQIIDVTNDNRIIVIIEALS